jgi:hypothetical protein
VPGERLSYWDFVKAAFWRPVRSRVLGAMPLTHMLLVAFGLAGFFNPGFWLLGLAALVSLVGGRSASARFQKLIAAERLARRASTSDDRMQQTYARLAPGSQARYRALVVLCREILGLAAPASEKAPMTDLRAGNLNQLLWLFLRLLSSREGIEDTLARVDRHQLEEGIETLRGRIAAVAEPDGALARSLKATLEIQEKRLANLDTASSSLAVIDAELERIEQQVRLVREESAISGRPELLSARLDAVSATLSETSRWMDQHADLLTDLTTADVDLDSVPAVPRGPSLPAEEKTPVSPPPPPLPRARQSQR